MFAAWRKGWIMELALILEAATMVLWVTTSINPGCNEVALAVAGVALTLWTLKPQQEDDLATPGKRRLCGLALRLHRCALAHVFNPRDRVSGSPLPALARLDWLLMGKSGVANVAAVTIATGLRYHSMQWLLLEQAISAALLARRAPAVCSVVAAQPPLARLIQVPALLWRWVPLPALGPRAEAFISSPSGLMLQCNAAVLFLIVNCVVAVPLCWGWGKGDPEGTPWLQLVQPLPPLDEPETPRPTQAKALGGRRQPKPAGASPSYRRRNNRRHNQMSRDA